MYIQQLKERLELEQSRLRAAHGISADEEAAATVAAAPSASSGDVASNSISASSSSATAAAAGSGGQRCNTCGGNFADAAAYRAHFRSVLNSLSKYSIYSISFILVF